MHGCSTTCTSTLSNRHEKTIDVRSLINGLLDFVSIIVEHVEICLFVNTKGGMQQSTSKN